MNKEIERKWICLKKDINFDLKNYNFFDIEQFYIFNNPVIRLRKKNNEYFLTYKDNFIEDEIERYEKNISISKLDYERLKKANEGLIIKKNRYIIPYNNYEIELDIFKEEYDGLIYAEVEFNNLTEANNFVSPNWFYKEVTQDKAFSNSSLAIKKLDFLSII